ncbi:MAG: hypothetical protein ACKN9T_12750 [Candidatus Methylumidiphilus sp.]
MYRRVLSTLFYRFIGIFAAGSVYGWAGNTDVQALLSLLLFALPLAGLLDIGQAARPYSYGAALAQSRDGLFRAFGWLAAVAAAYQTGLALHLALAGLWYGTAMESVVAPVVGFASIGLGAALGLALHLLPDWLGAARLAGRAAAVPVRETLNLGAAWALVWALFAAGSTFSAPPQPLLFSPESASRLLLACLAASAADGLLRFVRWDGSAAGVARRNRPGFAAPDWPDFGNTDGQSAASAVWLVFDRPLRQADGRLIDRLAARWQNIPVILAAPAGGALLGEHLRQADRLGRLQTLFPQLAVELPDWRRLLPPDARWQALPHREIYPRPALLPAAVRQLRGKADWVLLVADAERRWRWNDLRLPDATTAVLIHDTGLEAVPERIAGYRTVRLVSGYRLGLSALADTWWRTRKVSFFSLSALAKPSRLIRIVVMAWIVLFAKDVAIDKLQQDSSSASSDSASKRYSGAQKQPNFPGLFGMIEIGDRGVKGIVVDLALAQNDPGCQKDDEDVYADCIRRSVRMQFEPHNVDPLDKARMFDTVKAAKAIMDEMVDKFPVDPAHIYLVGSSSIGNKQRVPHRDEMQQKIEQALGKQSGDMRFVTAEQEGEWGFRGVLNLIPKKWREPD